MPNRGEEFVKKVDELLCEYSDHLTILTDGFPISWVVVAEYRSMTLNSAHCNFQLGSGSSTHAIGMLITTADVLRAEQCEFASSLHDEDE